MNLDDMRRLDALKTYKELEEAKKTIDDLKLRVKHDFETILKFKAENERLTKKIEQLYEGAEEQRHRIQRLEEAGDKMDETAEPFVLDTIDEDIPMSDVGEQYEIAYDSPPTAGDHVAINRARKEWRKAKEAKP